MTDTPGMSRREFLRSLGMSGVTLGVAGATGLTLAGEALGDPTAGGVHRRPWWVREVDEPTIGINWDVMQRVDASRDTLAGWGLGRFVSPEENARLLQSYEQVQLDRMLRGAGGYTLKDQALSSAIRSVRVNIPQSFLGPQIAPTPEERGVPRWEGSPEDNARILKVAMRQMGATDIGIVRLDDRTRKLIYRVDVDGKELVFADVEQPSEDDHRRVIPNRAEWAIVFTVQMSDEAMRRAPTKIAEQATLSAYQRGLVIQAGTQEFLRGLGYMGLGEAATNALGIAPALAVMSGLGELSRQNRVITPEHGPMVRIFKMITDLPLAPDKPIDAGITHFCKTCKKCAEACPPSALSFEEEPGWQPVGEWGNPGHQAWFEDSVRCKTYWYESAGTNCSICFAVCPFSKQNRSFMHDFIRMQIASVPVFNGLTRSMDDAFGYGVQKDPDEWWTQEHPEFGIDTRKGS